MTKLTAKFVNADGGTLRIFASPSKRGGVRVAATLKLSGQPAQTGCRQSFENGADAVGAFNALKAQALKRGWTEHVKKERSSAFSEIPPAAGTKVKKSAAA